MENAMFNLLFFRMVNNNSVNKGHTGHNKKKKREKNRSNRAQASPDAPPAPSPPVQEAQAAAGAAKPDSGPFWGPEPTVRPPGGDGPIVHSAGQNGSDATGPSGQSAGDSAAVRPPGGDGPAVRPPGGDGSSVHSAGRNGLDATDSSDQSAGITAAVHPAGQDGQGVPVTQAAPDLNSTQTTQSSERLTGSEGQNLTQSTNSTTGTPAEDGDEVSSNGTGLDVTHSSGTSASSSVKTGNFIPSATSTPIDPVSQDKFTESAEFARAVEQVTQNILETLAQDVGINRALMKRVPTLAAFAFRHGLPLHDSHDVSLGFHEALKAQQEEARVLEEYQKQVQSNKTRLYELEEADTWAKSLGVSVNHLMDRLGSKRYGLVLLNQFNAEEAVAYRFDKEDGDWSKRVAETATLKQFLSAAEGTGELPTDKNFLRCGLTDQGLEDLMVLGKGLFPELYFPTGPGSPAAKWIEWSEYRTTHRLNHVQLSRMNSLSPFYKSQEGLLQLILACPPSGDRVLAWSDGPECRYLHHLEAPLLDCLRCLGAPMSAVNKYHTRLFSAMNARRDEEHSQSHGGVTELSPTARVELIFNIFDDTLRRHLPPPKGVDPIRWQAGVQRLVDLYFMSGRFFCVMREVLSDLFWNDPWCRDARDLLLAIADKTGVTRPEHVLIAYDTPPRELAALAPLNERLRRISNNLGGTGTGGDWYGLLLGRVAVELRYRRNNLSRRRTPENQWIRCLRLKSSRPPVVPPSAGKPEEKKKGEAADQSKNGSVAKKTDAADKSKNKSAAKKKNPAPKDPGAAPAKPRPPK